MKNGLLYSGPIFFPEKNWPFDSFPKEKRQRASSRSPFELDIPRNPTGSGPDGQYPLFSQAANAFLAA